MPQFHTKKLKTNFTRSAKLHNVVARKIADQQIRRLVGPTRKIHLPKSFLNLYPQQMNRLNARMNVVQPMTVSASNIMAFKGNSFLLSGPRSNNAGAFASNVPSGLYYLLSSNATAGAVAPYEFYRIHSSRIKVRIISGYAAGAANTEGLKVIIYPSLSASNAGTLLTQAVELPKCKYALCPASTTGKQFTLSNTIDSPTMFGQKATFGNDNEYIGSATVDPVNLWYWQVYISSVDSTATVSYVVDITIDYDFDVLSRNTFVTTVPA